MACVAVETVMQLKRLAGRHNRQLEAIAEFSRHITSTLDKAQVMTLLKAAFRNAVEADTYFVGVREGDELRLDLIFDDGQYYENRARQTGRLPFSVGPGKSAQPVSSGLA